MTLVQDIAVPNIANLLSWQPLTFWIKACKWSIYDIPGHILTLVLIIYVRSFGFQPRDFAKSSSYVGLGTDSGLSTDGGDNSASSNIPKRGIKRPTPDSVLGHNSPILPVVPVLRRRLDFE